MGDAATLGCGHVAGARTVPVRIWSRRTFA